MMAAIFKYLNKIKKGYLHEDLSAPGRLISRHQSPEVEGV